MGLQGVHVNSKKANEYRAIIETSKFFDIKAKMLGSACDK